MLLTQLSSLGLSSLCNTLAAIKVAKHFGLGPDDVVVTVATDGASMYESERDLARARYFSHGFDEVDAAEIFGEHLLGASTDHVRELTHEERLRIFNLGYFTWVEQQGVRVEDFTARRQPAFWQSVRDRAAEWDALIDELNERTGLPEEP